MIYRCPFCNFTAKKLFGLKIHFRSAHMKGIGDRCPACGHVFQKKLSTTRNLIEHCRRFNDDKHLVLYYLLKSCRKNGKNSFSILSVGKEVAEILIKRGDIKFNTANNT